MFVYDALDLYIPNACRHPTGHLAIFGRTRLLSGQHGQNTDHDGGAAFECKLPNKWSGAVVSLQRQTADNFVNKCAYLKDL